MAERAPAQGPAASQPGWGLRGGLFCHVEDICGSLSGFHTVIMTENGAWKCGGCWREPQGPCPPTPRCLSPASRTLCGLVPHSPAVSREPLPLAWQSPCPCSLCPLGQCPPPETHTFESNACCPSTACCRPLGPPTISSRRHPRRWQPPRGCSFKHPGLSVPLPSPSTSSLPPTVFP